MDQSPQIIQQTSFYGSADNTGSVSETGIRFVRANSKSKSEDLGPIGECCLSLAGSIGTRDGRNSVFVHFRLLEPNNIRLVRCVPVPVCDDRLLEIPSVMARHQDGPNMFHAKYICVGLSDRYGNQIGLDDQGFCIEGVAPKGDYYATITTQHSTPLSFHVQLVVGNPMVQQEPVRISR